MSKREPNGPRGVNRYVQVVGWISVCLIIVLAFPILMSFLPLWRDAEEVDIRSGELRYTKYRLWYPVSRHVTPTPISRELGLSASPETADWQLVNTFSPGMHYSPHYAFHGAITQMKDLASFWEYREFTPQARKESAARLLAAWQQGNNSRAATKFMMALLTMTNDRAAEQPQRPIDVDDIPR